MQITIPYETGHCGQSRPWGELRDRNVRPESDLIKKHRTAFGKLLSWCWNFREFSFPRTAKDIHLAIDWQKWSAWSFSQKLFGTHLWTQTHTHLHCGLPALLAKSVGIAITKCHRRSSQGGKAGHWAISLATLTGTAADASAPIVGPIVGVIVPRGVVTGLTAFFRAVYLQRFGWRFNWQN